MKLNVYGRKIEIIKENGEWVIYSLGEGKKRRENEIVIPGHYNEKEVFTFIADIYHENATPQNPDIESID